MAQINKTWLIPSAAICLLLLLVALMAGIFRDKVSPGLNEPEQVSVDQAVAVFSQSLTMFEPVAASVEAKQATLISSRILAGVTAINVRAGDTVSEGQLLLELEKKDLLNRAQQAKENIRAISARLKESQLNFERVVKLKESGVVAAADVDKSRAMADSLSAELASAKQALEESETAVRYAEIRSPINGRVVDRFAEPGDTAAPGQKLLSLYNPLSLRIEAQVREQLALPLVVGESLQVEIPSLNKMLTSEIEEIVPAADSGSRSFLVKARMAYDSALLPGMYARLLVPAGEQQQLMIPAKRVARMGQLSVVWVLEDGQANRRFVRTGRKMDDGTIEVLAGLNEGELVLPLPQSTSE